MLSSNWELHTTVVGVFSKIWLRLLVGTEEQRNKDTSRPKPISA